MKTVTVMLLTLLLTSCSLGGVTQPTLFYTLSPYAEPISSRTKTDVSIGLGPISLPLLLDRPQMVLRRSNTEVDVDEFHRWGEDLSENLSHVMVRNLMHDLHTDRIARYPWPDYRHLDYQIAIEVFQFDAQFGDKVILEGVWSLVDLKQHQERIIARFSIHENILAPAYKAVADAHSQALMRLSQRIAKAVKTSLSESIQEKRP